MTDTQRVIRYLGDCHEADSRGSVLVDLKHRKISQFSWLTNSNELLSGQLDCVPIDQPTAEKAKQDTFLDEVNKVLSDRDFETWPAYGLAGLTMDLVVQKFSVILAIDLIGRP